MIVFYPGPRGVVANATEKKYIEYYIKSCGNPHSLTYKINMAYNRLENTNYEGPDDPSVFMAEIYTLSTNSRAKIIVEGGIHSSHVMSTAYAYQLCDYSKLHQVYVKDSHITFRAEVERSEAGKFRHYDTLFKKSHLLIEIPTIIGASCNSPIYVSTHLSKDLVFRSELQNPLIYW
jgi:hypothetical protein